MSKATEKSTKREIFEILYKNLTALQNSYQHLQFECTKQLASNENSEETYSSEDLIKNMQIAKEACIRIERLKYYCALAVLSEGALVTEDELSKTIDEASYLLDVAQIEIESTDDDIRSWAISKRDYILDAKDVLLQVLSDKIDTRVRRGLTLWQ